jgi:hypothetical protein
MTRCALRRAAFAPAGLFSTNGDAAEDRTGFAGPPMAEAAALLPRAKATELVYRNCSGGGGTGSHFSYPPPRNCRLIEYWWGAEPTSAS